MRLKRLCKKVECCVNKSPKCTEFLQTYTDNTLTANLLSLPKCVLWVRMMGLRPGGAPTNNF